MLDRQGRPPALVPRVATGAPIDPADRSWSAPPGWRSSSRCASCGSWSSRTRPASPATCAGAPGPGALLEDHTCMHDGRSVIVDMARFMQFGSWEGTRRRSTVGHDDAAPRRGRRHPRPVVGCSARRHAHSAGRPVHGPPNAWLWAPIHFDDDVRASSVGSSARAAIPSAPTAIASPSATPWPTVSISTDWGGDAASTPSPSGSSFQPRHAAGPRRSPSTSVGDRR